MKTTSDLNIPAVVYKLFDNCELDNHWKDIHKPSDDFYTYEAFVDNSKVELSILGLKKTESYSFKKSAIIEIYSGILKYKEQDLMK